MKTLLPLLVALVAVLVWAVAIKYLAHRRVASFMVTLRLSFGRDLDLEAVTQFLGGISGLLAPWWRRWIAMPSVMFETVGEVSGIAHRLYVDSAWVEVVESMLQAALPNVRYEIVDGTETPPVVAAGVEYTLSSSTRSLRVDSVDLSAKLLTAIGNLSPGEIVVVQWIVSPHAPTAPVQVDSTRDRGRWRSPLWAGPQTVSTSEAASALRQKQARPLLLAAVRIGVQGEDAEHERRLLRRVEAVWHQTRAPGVHLQRRVLHRRRVAARVHAHAVPLWQWPLVLNVDELSGLLGWPIGVGQLPGLMLGTARLLPTPAVVPTVGTVLGDSLYPGQVRPIAVDEEARLRHLHLLGPTGTGKTSLIVNMAVSDMAAGYGVVILDVKGELVDAVLQRVPRHRRDDVVVLDPADSERPVGLNPLAAADGRGEIVVENLVGVFKSMFHSSWGPRTDDILRAALMTLVSTGGATLCEVPLLLTDQAYRRRLVGRLDDPIGLGSFWTWYDGLKDGERLAVIGAPLNKLRAFTMRPSVRAVVGQLKPALSFDQALAEGKIVLVGLASGLLGEEAANLLGALVVAELWHATKARAALSASERRPVMAYLDEWQNLISLPTSMSSVLAEARGFGLGLTLAHQSLSQVPSETRDAVLANARTRVCFQLPSSDARLVARELGGLLTADDLGGLGAYEVVISAFAAGSTQPPATAKTRPAPSAIGSAEQLRQLSRQRFGVDRAEIEAQLRARQQGPTVEAPLRRKPRDGGSGRAS